MKQNLTELRYRLNEICSKTNTNYSGIELLLNYYQKSLGWSEIDAIIYTINLFENGTIDSIKVTLGSDDSPQEGDNNDDDNE